MLLFSNLSLCCRVGGDRAFLKNWYSSMPVPLLLAPRERCIAHSQTVFVDTAAQIRNDFLVESQDEKAETTDHI